MNWKLKTCENFNKLSNQSTFATNKVPVQIVNIEFPFEIQHKNIQTEMKCFITNKFNSIST